MQHCLLVRFDIHLAPTFWELAQAPSNQHRQTWRDGHGIRQPFRRGWFLQQFGEEEGIAAGLSQQGIADMGMR